MGLAQLTTARTMPGAAPGRPGGRAHAAPAWRGNGGLIDHDYPGPCAAAVGIAPGVAVP